ncbi:MAG TPA: hypothetical protein DHW16_05885 [Ruminococcaceae bacterium]|nr:hypothetical protein [Oscillospiraceae bacterium]HCO38162.1 hypothetical protein [Oscillospiraceae bacterium]
MKLKRIISILMSITILSMKFAFPAINSNAQPSHNFAAFSGTYDYESPANNSSTVLDLISV